MPYMRLSYVSKATIVLSAIIVPQWRRVRQTEAETRLKHELLAAGMSAADIVQVVQASAANSSPVSRSRVRDPQYAVR